MRKRNLKKFLVPLHSLYRIFISPNKNITSKKRLIFYVGRKNTSSFLEKRKKRLLPTLQIRFAGQVRTHVTSVNNGENFFESPGALLRIQSLLISAYDVLQIGRFCKIVRFSFVKGTQ